MSRESFDRWLRYQENRELVDQAFDYVTRLGKDAIRQDDGFALRALTRLATMLLATYAECRLNETIWYYSRVDEEQRRALPGLSIEDRWYKVIDLGFASLRGITVRQVPNSLTFTDKARRDELRKVASEYIVPLIEARNSIAHGQWRVAFNSNGSTVNQRRTAVVNRYSIWRVTLEKNVVDHFSWIVHDLLIARYAHERDFDKRIGNLHSAVHRIKKGNQRKWESGLRARYQRRPQLPTGA